MGKKEDKKAKKTAKKEAKAAKKANKEPMAPETKKTWIQCATALVCVVALSVSSTVAIGKYAEAIEKTPVSTGTGAVVAAPGGSDDTTPADDTAATDDTTPADDTATTDDTTPADDTAATDDATTPADDSTPADDKGSSAGNKTNDPTGYSKAEVVNYYNQAIKKSTSAAKVTITRAETIAIACDKLDPDSKALQGIVNKILNNYAKTTTKTASFANGKVVSGDYDKDASKFVCPSDLEAAGAKSATITKSGSDYVVNIAVVAEKSTLDTKPKFNKQCSAPLDLSTVDLFGVKVTQADFSYPGTTIKATIGANGLAKTVEIYQPLSGTGGGKAIGIGVAATLHGSFKQVDTYKY